MANERIMPVGKDAYHYIDGRTKDPEYHRQRKHKWYLDHKEYRCQYNKDWREDNPNYKKDWRKNNSEKDKAYIHKRRQGSENLTPKIVQLVYEDNIKQYGTLTCYLCIKPIEFGKDCLEHKTPISQGGKSEYNNLAVAHRICNLTKGKKTYEEYICQIT